MKKCYYEVLGIPKTATQDEIKIAYRKQALINHPDKNHSDDAKQIFQAINEAYQTLSDVNERSWYDNHKEQILRGSDISKDDVEQKTYGFNIWQFFNGTCYTDYEDENPKGFYSVFRDVFIKIKSEELSVDEFCDLPAFGNSKTDIEEVFEFYERWVNYTTERDFAWVEQYNPNDGESRFEKRYIEKENKKLRDVEKKKYIKTIRQLAEFVKKRDPRVKTYLEEKKKQEDIKLQLKKQQELIEKEEKLNLLQQRRIEEQKRFHENEMYFKEKQGVNYEVHHKEHNLEEEIYYCEACDKEFKSEKQLENHHQSKAHKTNMKRIIEHVDNEQQKQTLLEQHDIKDPKKVISQQQETKKSKKNKKKRNKKAQINQSDDSEEENNQNQKKQSDEEQDDQNDNQNEEKLNQETFTKQKENEQIQQEKKQKEERKEEIKERKISKDTHTGSEDDIARLSQFLKNTAKPKNVVIVEQERKISKDTESEDDIEKLSKFIKNTAKPKNVVISQVQEQKVEAKEQAIIPQQNENTQQKSKYFNDDDKSESDEQKPEVKLNKAKLKKQKKKEKNQNSGMHCRVCGEDFESKSKLFKHVKDMKHMQAD